MRRRTIWRELIILTIVSLLAVLAGVQSVHREDFTQPVTASPPHRNGFVKCPVPPPTTVRVAGAEKIFYGYYFTSPDASLIVSPGPNQRVICNYGNGKFQFRASMPGEWHATVLRHLADAGLENRWYSFNADGDCSLSFTYFGRSALCGKYAPGHPAATDAEAAAAHQLRSEVAALLASPPSDAQNCTFDGAAHDALWNRYYESDALSAALEVVGLRDHGSDSEADNAFRKIDQEFLARYRSW